MSPPIRLQSAGLEITLACPYRCQTCGSNAGAPRTSELCTDEWLAVIRDLADLGCERLALLGGEPLLRPDWVVLARAAGKSGIQVELLTSGVGVDADIARRIADLGLASVTVSVDGTRQAHDRQRCRDGSYDRALSAIGLLDRIGMRVGVTTQVNRETLYTLEALAPEIEAAGAMGWQLQLTMPAGRAREHTDLVLAPHHMPELYRIVRRLVERRGLRPVLTDNIGYFTSDEPRLRTPARQTERCWLGCFAGLRNIGVLSDGSVKGCLALPDSMIEGNVRERSLASIWNDPGCFAYSRSFRPETLGGACAECAFGKLCRGGCTAFAMAVHSQPGMSTHCFRLHDVS
jgi:radical SAM protein with 4Fe4S-binding SPASM domain